MSYDLDGNRTGDAKWSYTWKNGRCERVTWATTPTPGTAGPVDNHYVYDENGRVISRTAGGQVDLYFWQGHLRMAERAQSGSYPGMIYLLWGTGSLDGAGGVGGLRASYAAGYYSQYPVYRGNHNVEAWYNKVGGLAAEIKYNAYGLIVAKTGQPFANFGFQTQYTDLSTGLICYEQRWYDPRTQTWVSLDPIEEQGGVNLYGFCGGNGLRSYDALGQLSYPSFSKEILRAASAQLLVPSIHSIKLLDLLATTVLLRDKFTNLLTFHYLYGQGESLELNSSDLGELGITFSVWEKTDEVHPNATANLIPRRIGNYTSRQTVTQSVRGLLDTFGSYSWTRSLPAHFSRGEMSAGIGSFKVYTEGIVSCTGNDIQFNGTVDIFDIWAFPWSWNVLMAELRSGKGSSREVITALGSTFPGHPFPVEAKRIPVTQTGSQRLAYYK